MTYPTETSPFDHFHDSQSMPRLFKNNKPMVDSNFAFIDPVSAVYYGGGGGGGGGGVGSDWLRAYQNDFVIDNYFEPAVI